MGSRAITTNIWIGRWEHKFGKGKFDYSSTNVQDASTKCSIFCNECQKAFMVTPTFFYKSNGCPNCIRDKKGITKGITRITKHVEKQIVQYIHDDKFPDHVLAFMFDISEMQIKEMRNEIEGDNYHQGYDDES